MQVALILSLALNLVIIGSVAGAVWRFRKAAALGQRRHPQPARLCQLACRATRRKQLWDATTLRSAATSARSVARCVRRATRLSRR